MDVLNDRVIDVGLNIVGFIAAGLLTTLVYSAIQSRRLKQSNVRKSKADRISPSDVQTSGSQSPADNKTVDFIDLSQTLGRRPAVDGSSVALSTPAVENARRNRAEIIRIARKMIQVGASMDRIKNTLPISEGELAMLNQSQK